MRVLMAVYHLFFYHICSVNKDTHFNSHVVVSSKIAHHKLIKT